MAAGRTKPFRQSEHHCAVLREILETKSLLEFLLNLKLKPIPGFVITRITWTRIAMEPAGVSQSYLSHHLKEPERGLGRPRELESRSREAFTPAKDEAI